MTCEQFWADLRSAGFTKHKVIHEVNPRSVILQNRDGDFPLIDHPDDLSTDERAAVLSAFLRRYTI